MKIGIVSDTHGNIDMLENVVDWLIRKHKISVLYHLGDDYNDVGVLADRFLEIVQVPGLYDERYRNQTLPSKLFEMVLGLTILLVHSTDKDATRDDISKSDIILSGHTHKEELRLEDGRLFMNPGHLKGPLDKNMPPTFGFLGLQDRGLTATIYSADFKTVRTMELVRSGSGLYKT
jgi:uncharacterized protein